MKVLVTGGLGYLGSHTCVELLANGYDVVVLDNLYNSSVEAKIRIEKITKRSLDFVEGDIRDAQLLDGLFKKHNIETVIHFAGLKAVGEGQQMPTLYHDVNVVGSHILFSAMEHAGISNIVFSSSATVYGAGARIPYEETSPVSPSNVYGNTKRIVEMMLADLCEPNNSPWSVALLRYFNPIGAHPSGLIGEDPLGIPNNLMPYIAKVAVGELEMLSVFGNDYPTKDGTGIRDYIHVVDLARGHVSAVQYLQNHQGAEVFNLGSGKGYSVLELVDAFERVNGIKIPYQISPRRAGDLAEFFANPAKALAVLGWKTECNLEQMLADTWRWQKNNPKGYGQF